MNPIVLPPLWALIGGALSIAIVSISPMWSTTAQGKRDGIERIVLKFDDLPETIPLEKIRGVYHVKGQGVLGKFKRVEIDNENGLLLLTK